MKKCFIKLTTLMILVAASPLCALTDAQAKNQAELILRDMVGAHTTAFGESNLYNNALNLGAWNGVISRMKTLVTTVINENKNFFGMRDSTLTKALEKITKAEIDLVNAIKVTRGVLSSPPSVQKQVIIFNQIKNDMLDVQKSLQSSMSPVAKDEARKLLNSTAMFIETTAAKAAKDAQK